MYTTQYNQTNYIIYWLPTQTGDVINSNYYIIVNVLIK